MLSPLSAKLYAEIILTDDGGITFQMCQKNLGASKATVSAALNLLQKMGFISFFTKPGDRKRYFTVSHRKTYFQNKLQEQLKKIKQDRTILKLVNDYHKKYSPDHHEKYGIRNERYIEFLDATENLIRENLYYFKNLN